MSQAFFRRNLDDLFVKRTCDILIGRKPPLRKPVIYKNITNPPEVVISRWYSNLGQVCDIIKTGCQVKEISNLFIVKSSPSTDNLDMSNAPLKPT